MSLIEQRNRFLSFAFASADILIETDMEGRACYAAGASALLGMPPINESDEHLAQRLDRTSRPILKALMRGLRPGKRAGPARITINGKEARLCGWLLGDDDKIRWTLSFDAVDAPVEIDPEVFERTAEISIAAARENDQPMEMSVLRVDGIDDLDREIGDAPASRLRKAIFSETLLSVGENGVVRQVGANRWALIHVKSADLKKLEKQVNIILKDNKFDRAKAKIETVSDAKDLDPKIAVQAFIHAVNQAAESDCDLDITSLKDVAAVMMEETTRRMNEIKTTIAGRVFEPFAQAVVDIDSGEIEHYEVLLRMPGGKPVGDNIGFAESTGLIFEIDLAMTEIAANFLRDDYDRPALAVNLSGKSLANPSWGKKFLSLLGDLKIDRSRLHFELTETACISNTKAANSVIQKIRERGHKVFLDDFGVGTAGFGYLRDFPADVVKIDGSFLRRASQNERDATIFKGMVALCTELGAETVAEMIETKDQVQLAKAAGVTFGQGYYFGKPLPLKTLTDPRKTSTKAA